MRLFIKMLITGILCYFIQPHIGWWGALVIPFAVSFLIKSSAWNAFFAGFLGVGLTWLFVAWQIDHNSQSLLTGKMARLFQLNDPVYMLIITFVVGAVVGAVGSLTGHNLIKLFEKKKSGYY